MQDSMVQLQTLNRDGHGLRVVFIKRADRWRHMIERVAGEQATLVLQSQEGDASAAWPASPPFQELSDETLPDGRRVLFLVGRAGTSHWSASIEAALDPPRLIFDIACRHTQPPEQLGSAYVVAAPAVELTPLDGLASVQTQATLTQVIPTTIASRLPGTTRWKYCIQ